jgi:hypothetical protein
MECDNQCCYNISYSFCEISRSHGGESSMKFRFVFWDVLPCKIIVDRRFRGTCCLHHQGDESVHNYFTRQYIPEGKSELITAFVYIKSMCRIASTKN